MTTNIKYDQHSRTRSDVGNASLIVILGSENGFQNLLRVIVNEFGYHSYADEIHEGIVQQIARLRPGAVVLDVDYGHEQLSWAMIRALKEFPETTDIPVIACAAASWLLDEQRSFLDHNDVRTWTEPFEIAELLRTLDSALTGPRPDRCAVSRQSHDGNFDVTGGVADTRCPPLRATHEMAGSRQPALNQRVAHPGRIGIWRVPAA